MTRTIALLIASALTSAIAGSAQAADEQNFPQIEAGRRIAIEGDCAGCHTLDPSKPFAGGVVLQTPFGALVGSNITPDPETGIGAWSLSDFKNSLHAGLGKDGKRLYPAMPYTAFTKMTDSDVAALWTYMRSVSPVRNPVESNQLPFPFSIRLSMLGWNMLNFSPGRFKPDPARSAEWNRGAYLVDGPGHCGTCHTAKTTLGADDSSKPLRGGLLQGWYAPDITGDNRKGLGGWDNDDIVRYLKTGANGHTVASGPMIEVIQKSTSKMPDADLRAMAVYLKQTTTSSPSVTPVAATDPAMVAGGAIYKDTCAACHKDDGTGQPNMFPRLAGSAIVQSDDPATLLRVVMAGGQGAYTKGAPTTPAMPSFAWRLNDQQVADVLTYVRNAWGNAAAPVSSTSAKDSRGAP
ncbi:MULTISPECIES: cytochrome c [unclassified Beijerinckia]|uniref:cytochrome c n=1 Tax=unclassified Beijerinckia TaxID=2638183 RepID=UPI000894CDD8|nr:MULTISPECIES: cytochrome c [unclassified Beijerinckia]MDH7797205.1 mono/diheme cytochrome c family protein [Beijerinckia sp. GAS462]SEC76243.1 Cytochrome c, mono-and diheme variants [Beijerinckia sp. 28-YEA-48]